MSNTSEKHQWACLPQEPLEVHSRLEFCGETNSFYPKVCLQTVSNYVHKFEMKIVLAFSHSLPGNRKLKVPGSEYRPGSLSLCRTSVGNGTSELMVACEWFLTRARPKLWSLSSEPLGGMSSNNLFSLSLPFQPSSVHILLCFSYLSLLINNFCSP